MKASQEKTEKYITPNTTLFWFRRDLRLADNGGLYHALRENEYVLPVFIFDTTILDRLEDKKDRRVAFIYEALRQLKKELEEAGSSLLVVHSDPLVFFKSISPRAVYTNHDYEPYAKSRDEAIANNLTKRNIKFKSFKDQVIFEKDEVLKDDGHPYTVFTPYGKKWKANLKPFHYKPYPVEKYLNNLTQIDPMPLPSLSDIGFKSVESDFPPRKIRTSVIEQYDRQRNYPAIDGTTRLSVHLRFGTISIRKLVSLALKKNEAWLNELIWREFYHMILWHFPHVEKAFKPAYDQINWRNDPDEFKAWCEGRTGYPIVDAGMRELNATGFMHNRVRMIVASFLTKHLLIDWRWGEAYFAKKLLDFDLAANNGGWQWAAGSGCDAAPYFRVFNPYLQTDKFDPDFKYIRRWVPEFETDDYPAPIIEHSFARERVLKVYKAALQNS
ncbi:MAG: deoxyribodipyrimidine photo-lyase [Cyclobacteriaceae bacterium]